MTKATYHLISSEKEPMEDRLTQRLEECQTAIIATAFFTLGAYDALKDSLLATLDNNAKITFLLGRWDYVTEPRAVRKLIEISQAYPKQLQVFFDSDFNFHYKLAAFKNKKRPVVIIGSSNLTPKGLATAGEANLEIVGNYSVYHQAVDCLRKRVGVANSANDSIAEYEGAYDRAKKLRTMRQSWHNSGLRKWRSSRRRFPLSDGPEGTTFTLCWIGSYEHDKILKANILKERTTRKRADRPMPGTWVHMTPKTEASLYKEGEDFIVVDDLARSFGFAFCTEKIRKYDSRNSLEHIIFYKYRRGWKASFSERAAYKRCRDKLFPRYQPEIGKVVSDRLKQYLRRRQIA